MRIRHFITAIALCATIACNGQQINPITKAVLDGYTELLQKDPKDYNTLYQRAAQYYGISYYDNALNDIIKAIEYTPAKEIDTRVKEFSLMSDIYTELKEYNKALVAINQALVNDPKNYGDLYKKGNILLHLGDGANAYSTFQSMQRLKSRSQEAFFGMAKASLLMGKTKEAEALIKEAENADPNNYITYCRTGNIYEDMNRNSDAAGAYLSAFGLALDTSRPLGDLLRLGKKDFQAVGTAIDYATDKSTNKAPLYFLKANIAYQSGNYKDAYEAFSKLVGMPEGRESSVYSSLALTCLALNKLEEAGTNADLALLKEKSPDSYLVKARVDLAAGKPAFALMNAKKAMEADPASTEAQIVAALASMDLGENQAALKTLNETVLNNASDPLPLMLRAYLNKEKLKNTKGAVADYARVSQLEPDTFRGKMLKALAKSLNGKKLDGDNLMKKYLEGNEDKENFFLAAIYYSQTGDLETARQMRDKATDSGFQNIYELEADKTANLNINPIRHLK